MMLITHIYSAIIGYGLSLGYSIKLITTMHVCFPIATSVFFLTRTKSANDSKKQDYSFHGIEFRKLNYK